MVKGDDNFLDKAGDNWKKANNLNYSSDMEVLNLNYSFEKEAEKLNYGDYERKHNLLSANSWAIIQIMKST